jgi:hypothetical protein
MMCPSTRPELERTRSTEVVRRAQARLNVFAAGRFTIFLFLLLATLLFAQDDDQSPFPIEVPSVGSTVTMPISATNGDQLMFSGTFCDAESGRMRLAGKITNDSSNSWTTATLKIEFQADELRFTTVGKISVPRGLPTITYPMTWGEGRAFENCLASDGSRVIHRVLSATLIGWTDSQQAVVDKLEAEARRQKRMKAEAARKKAEAEQRAREDQLRSQREAVAARLAATARLCKAVYQETHNMKTGDLTVDQTDAINSCKVLGLYRP